MGFPTWIKYCTWRPLKWNWRKSCCYVRRRVATFAYRDCASVFTFTVLLPLQLWNCCLCTNIEVTCCGEVRYAVLINTFQKFPYFTHLSLNLSLLFLRLFLCLFLSFILSFPCLFFLCSCISPFLTLVSFPFFPFLFIFLLLSLSVFRSWYLSSFLLSFHISFYLTQW